MIRKLVFGSVVLQSMLLANQRNYLQDHWTATGDFVYMLLNYNASTEPLVDDPYKVRRCGSCQDFSVLRLKDLDDDYEPGYRVSLMYLPNYWLTLEGKFMYLRPSSQVGVVRATSLYYPFCDRGQTTDFQGATSARACYKTHFWDVELNAWWNITPRWVDYFSLSLIGGLRYFNETESFTDKFTHLRAGSSTVTERSTLKTWTENNIGAMQIGLNLQINPSHYFSWEINGKGGFMVDDAHGGMFVKDRGNQTTLSHFRGSEVEFGLFADLSAAIVFSFARHFDFHIGYDYLILSNLACAKDLLPECAYTTKKHFHADSTVSVYGVFGGLGISF